jgi:Ca-activated chloride channel family protein
MFEFAHPRFLLLALAVPPLLWWWLRRPRAALRYSATGFLAGLPAGRSRLARWGGAGLRATALLLLIVALAGPRRPDLHTRLPTEGIAIELLVDVSGSMAQNDYRWRDQPVSRLQAVKNALHLFVAGGEGPDGQHLAGRPDDLVGLVTFATRPESPSPLTLSHSVLLQLLDAEQPRSVPTEDSTNIGDAIAWGLHRLEGSGSQRKVMVLLSDGEHNVPPPALKPRQAAQLAANLGIPIYTIDAGSDPAEATTPGSAEIRAGGEQTLQAVARITGGRSFKARDTRGLLDVYQAIDRLERREIRSFHYRRYFEGYPWVGLASFVLWIGIFVLDRTLWLRLP